MFGRNKKKDPELSLFSDEELALIPLSELQRIRNKRWANQKHELVKRVDEELTRRDPRTNWKCLRCGNDHFHEREIHFSGSATDVLFNREREKYHVITCNYCGNSEFYSTLASIEWGEHKRIIMP